jgi:hypothetical protein
MTFQIPKSAVEALPRGCGSAQAASYSWPTTVKRLRLKRNCAYLTPIEPKRAPKEAETLC